jgi:DNA modification methylase
LVEKEIHETPLAEIEKISTLDHQLEDQYKSTFIIERQLDRTLVSFQANKNRAIYRWYKYKEAFSAALVEFLLEKYAIKSGTLLDPFAGIGTSLFVASEVGLNAHGIELLPIGQKVIKARDVIQNELKNEDIKIIKNWIKTQPWEHSAEKVELNELRITKGSYPPETLEAIKSFLAVSRLENPRVQVVLELALLSILESISYTRKDGQYLRWDERSGRRTTGKPFNKGPILGFKQAINNKLEEFISDIECNNLFIPADISKKGKVDLFNGSCLDILPKLLSNNYDVILTSPPYCNRYDYTRTYALELALLDINEQELSDLRQTMITCTVENKEKDLLLINPAWKSAIEVTNNQTLLQEISRYLKEMKTIGKLNNNSIPRMIKGYFYEMSCIISECYRVLKQDGFMMMVNDNVQYAGVNIPVDLILSSIASGLGFEIESILVLPVEKGNSSQQMGLHGRKPLRKCVYIWRKP